MDETLTFSSSSCNLLYKTANLKINTTDKAGQDALSTSEAPAEQPGGIRLDGSHSDSAEDNNNAKDSPEWAEATVVVTSSTTDKPSSLIPQARQQGLWDLPWNEDDLRHFKRVLIPDIKRHTKLSNASALERLSMAYARLVAKSRDAMSDRLSFTDNRILERLQEYGTAIFVISGHPGISRLPSDANFVPDWRTLLHFRALTDLNALTEDSKQLFKEMMILYHKLSNYGHLEPAKQKFEKRYPVVTNLLVKSHRLQMGLDQLFDIDNAWRHGGLLTTSTITQKVQTDPEEPEEAHDVATCLEVTETYIILALDTGTISIFNHNGKHLRSLHGHTGGVWATAIYGDILVSGSVDREVRVWDIVTGYVLNAILGKSKIHHTNSYIYLRESIYALNGHASTVRCLTFVNKDTAVSGGRDGTLRVWNIRNGLCTGVLSGHNHSVRCVVVTGDLIVSGSYDKTARIWNVFDGHCIWTLSGHLERIYCIAADSKRVATGSMDRSVRVWDIRTGFVTHQLLQGFILLTIFLIRTCLAVLQGHTSLVGQLQLYGDTVVTGCSDGSVRVWSLLKMAPIHRISAAEKSVTSLQVDHHRIISGSIEGTVRVWDRSTGELIRELGARSGRVWRVHMSESMAIVVRSSSNKLMLEVKEYLSHRPLQLLTNTRSGHFNARISQDRATKVALPRVALMRTERMRTRIMIMVLHEIDFPTRMSTPSSTLAHVSKWRLTFDEGSRKRNHCSSQESQIGYHCTCIEISTDMEIVTQEVVFVSLCVLPKGHELYNWPSPLASTSSLSPSSPL
jgi:WD40 repeat protein